MGSSGDRQTGGGRGPRAAAWLIAASAAWLACAGSAAAQRTIDRADYERRLRGMWLGQCIANWTGLQREGWVQGPPFLTDEHWGPGSPGGPLDFVLTQDPWGADDDTDIEYVYLHLMNPPGGPVRALLPAETIRAGWLAHMDPQYLWVSNRHAYELMRPLPAGRNMTPPSTGLGVANHLAWMIDAQLTTEFFGALAPGLPEVGLALADLPIRTTSTGFATHASQFYVVLYAQATQIPPGLSGRDQAVWLVREARRWIPGTSKSADVADFVLADFLNNPDPSDWERTRDRVYERYQRDAAANGFVYQGWFESSVNFATGLIALLYGQMDYKRTVQIGTLSGWDCDNGTATMGGLLGLVLGEDGVRAQFSGPPYNASLSERFWILRTRVNLPDYLPGDPQAEDTFTRMASRMLPLVDQAVAMGGGRAGAASWTLPPAPPAGLRVLGRSPTEAEHRRSATHEAMHRGAAPAATASHPGVPWWPPWVYGSGDPRVLANGLELDWRGLDRQNELRLWFSSHGGGAAPGQDQTLEVVYDRVRPVAAVRFVEGDHFGPAFNSPPGLDGGWFGSLRVELRVGGSWVPVPAAMSEPLDANRPFQVIDLVLPASVPASGVRIIGPGGGGFVTCAELDALSPAPAAPTPIGPGGAAR